MLTGNSKRNLEVSLFIELFGRHILELSTLFGRYINKHLIIPFIFYHLFKASFKIFLKYYVLKSFNGIDLDFARSAVCNQDCG